MMLSVLVYILLATYLTTIQAVPGKNCKDTCQCDPGECCQRLRLIQVVSRREEADIDYNAIEEIGTCQLYKRQGEWCDIFGERNGYCECAPGQTCHFEPPVTSPPVTSPPTSETERDIREGTYTCETEP